ncbi:amino acid adenylation domain-containing protein [Plantactinospora sp. B5E13]|uniref:amino acid adenylation domain-containing protein n=1 Tax=Plantactinospora sp. B5E13 TaxID=3153758 RepID=UPI00325FD7FB
MPASAAQRRMVFSERLHGGTGTYLIPVAWRLDGPLDLAGLRSALDRAVHRHDALRMALPDDGLHVVLHPARPIPLVVEDISGHDEAERRRLVDDALLREAETPFDLARPPLVRARVLRTGPEEHVIVLTAHHAMVDGRGLEVVLADLGAEQTPRPLTPAHGFAGHLRSAQQRPEPGREFWRAELAGSSGVLAVPVDHPRPRVLPDTGATLRRTVPIGLRRAVAELARTERGTVPMVWLALYALLLARWTGTDDLVVGMPAENRPEDAEDLVGMFVSVLPLRIRVDRGATVRELVRSVRNTCIQAYGEQDVPLEAIIEDLGLSRDLSRAPLVQVMYTHRAPHPRLDLPAIVAVPLEVPRRYAKLDLTLETCDTATGTELLLEYASAIFAPESVRRLLDSLVTLARNATRDPDVAVGDLPVLSPEQEEMIGSWQGDTVPMAAETLARAVADQAGSRPDTVALVDGTGTSTAGEVLAAAGALAARLRAAGAGPGQRVAVCLRRGRPLPVALLAVAASGAAYVPLDPDHPPARTRLVLDDSAPVAVVTEPGLRDRLGAGTVPVFEVTGADLRSSTASFPPCPAGPDDPVYAIYTSGSTGRPKGALNSHRAVLNRLRWGVSALGIGPDDVLLQKTPFSFDVSVPELFTPLLTGARLVLAEPGAHRDPARLAALIAGHGVTIVHFVPSMLAPFLDEPASADLPSLRHVICSGEALPAGLARRVVDRYPGVRLWNLFGPTETAIEVTAHQYDPDRDSTTVPMGRPVWNTVAHVLDERMRPVPVGGVGELCIGGMQVGMGYLNRPELTAERFSGHDGGRVYRTGDRVRWRADGSLEYLGRLDDQVKIRGQRVEPGEVTAALLRQPGVADAAVVARTDGDGPPRLVGYVVPTPDADCVPASLQAALAAELPPGHVPSALVTLDALPLMPNGKLDRMALPAPAPVFATGEPVPPAPGAERTLADIWADVLGLTTVGATDNFFQLGGDSIRALQVIGPARAAGLGLDVPRMFSHPTVRGLAAVATRLRPAGAAPESTAEPTGPETFGLLCAGDRARLPDGLQDAYPATYLQRGMLFHGSYRPGESTYHEVFSVRVRLPWQPETFVAASRDCLATHPVLRTSFDLATFSVPMQLVHAEVTVPVELADLRALPEPERESFLVELFETERRRPFDWSQAPLLRIHLHRLPDEQTQLTLSFHHAVLDGWSASSLVAELVDRHLAACDNSPRVLPDPVQPFRDYVAAEQAAAADPEAGAFWADLLADTTGSPLPRWRRPSPAGGERVRLVRVGLDPQVAAGLTRAAASIGVPLKSVVVEAHVTAVALATGRTEVAVGLATNGRPESPGAERTLGLFLNTVPLPRRLRPGTWADRVRATFDAERAMLPHRRHPLALIQRAGGRLFDTLLNFNDFHVYEQVRAAGRFDPVGTPSVYGETDLTLVVHLVREFDGTLALHVASNRAELCDEQADALVDLHLTVLAAIAADPFAPAGPGVLLPAPERNRILARGRRGGPPVAGLTVNALVTARATVTPEAVAIRSGHRLIRYAELQTAATTLAARFAAAGVRPGDRVGLLLERSPEFVVAALAVLHSGAAYVPLDPAFPPARLRFMVRDSGASLVVTTTALHDLLDGTPTDLLLPFDADTPDTPVSPVIPQTPAPDVLGATPGSTTTCPDAVRTGPDDLAYLMYTSGSTGTPKAVRVPHRAIVRLVHGSDFAPLRPGDVVAQLSNTAFDAATFEIWGALVNGAELTIVDRETLLAPDALADALKRLGVTAMFLTTALFNETVRVRPDAFAGVGTVIVGGEALDAPLVRTVLAGAAPGRLLNGYGPTETTTFAAWHHIRHLDPDAPSVPIGIPIGNTDLYVLGDGLDPVPDGAVGELVVGGPGVALGYHERPELDAERFVPDPWRPDGLLYRTGDLARWRPDGTLEYHGRLDDQVKIRGFRIEPGEAAAALSARPGVAAATVLVREDRPGDRRLVGYVVAEPGVDPDPVGLREALRETLPRYLVPAAIVVLPALPVTVNGKLDRRALPAPPADSGGPVVEPRNPAEERVAAIWAETLGVERLGVHDDFFDLGGHSLQVARVVARIGAEWGLRLPMSILAEQPTVATLAEELVRLAARRDAQPDVPTVLRLQSGPESGGGVPVVLVHPVGGTCFLYGELANELGRDRLVLGLQAPGVEGEREPCDSIAALADYHVTALLGHLPAGPFVLAGLSMGGNIAYEMARLLAARGRPPVLVALLDSPGPGQVPKRFADDAELMAAAFADGTPATAELLRTMPPRQRLIHVLTAARAADQVPADFDVLDVDTVLGVWRAHTAALYAHVPGPYDGDVVYFRASETVPPYPPHPELPWRRLLGDRMPVVPVPGDHVGMVTGDGVSVIVSWFRRHVVR